MHTQNDSVTSSPTTTAQSEFYLSGTRFHFTTSCSVDIRSSPNDKVIQFISYPCEVVDDQLRKCYKINFKDTFVFIEDKITIDTNQRRFQKQSNTHNTSLQNNQNKLIRNKRKNKKMVLFKNSSLRNSELTGKNDKKNIVKNVVNAFLRFVKETHNEEESARSVIDYVSGLIQRVKYNNQLIKVIVEDQAPRDYFKQFLTVNAGEWVQQSKIKNKQIYEQALKIYEKLCDEKETDIHMQNKSASEQGRDISNSKSNNSLDFRQLQNYDLQQAIRGFK